MTLYQAWPWTGRHYDPYKRRKLLAKWHIITCQKAWIYSSTAMIACHFARHFFSNWTFLQYSGKTQHQTVESRLGVITDWSCNEWLKAMKIAFDFLLFFSYLATLLQLHSVEWVHTVQKAEMIPTALKEFLRLFPQRLGKELRKTSGTLAGLWNSIRIRNLLNTKQEF